MWFWSCTRNIRTFVFVLYVCKNKRRSSPISRRCTDRSFSFFSSYLLPHVGFAGGTSNNEVLLSTRRVISSGQSQWNALQNSSLCKKESRLCSFCRDPCGVISRFSVSGDEDTGCCSIRMSSWMKENSGFCCIFLLSYSWLPGSSKEHYFVFVWTSVILKSHCTIQVNGIQKLIALCRFLIQTLGIV